MTHVVATAVLDGADPFSFSVASEVFGVLRPELGPQRYEHRLCTPAQGAAISGGALVHGSHGLDGLETADTVLMPDGPPLDDPDPRLVAAVARAHDRGARLVSFCTGAFVLGAAGVLDGKRATTHWMYAEQFRARFPRVQLEPNVLFVDEGQVLTSAGSAAGIDLALHIVRSDHGAEVARGIARRMVVPPHREGGQAQYIDPPHQPLVDADDIAALLDWLAERLDQEVTVAQMARQAAMSERTFARRFKEATGTTPFRWLLHQRIHRARELLESTALDIDQVALRAGFGTATNLRDHFRRELGTSPSTYRRTCTGSSAPLGVA